MSLRDRSNLGFVQLLLEMEFDPNHANDRGDTALYIAVLQEAAYELARLLINWRGDVDVLTARPSQLLG